MEIVTEI